MIASSENDIKALQQIGRVVALAREEMIKSLKVGMTTKELDEIGGRVLGEFNAKSAPICEYNFPGYTCISVNDEVAHGIPGHRIFEPGDMVNIDVSAELNGYFADTGSTVIIEPAATLDQELCQCSRSALSNAIKKAKAGSRVNQIGRAIYNEARRCGFTVIRNLTGHGIGRKLHEEPEYVFNYYDFGENEIMKEGLVLAVETFISSGDDYVEEESNGWTFKTPNKNHVAQYEHTIIVTRGEPVILTAL